ncbi:MAG TPA: c-type cytochrome [Alphaproteobacteria bacterium]
MQSDRSTSRQGGAGSASSPARPLFHRIGAVALALAAGLTGRASADGIVFRHALDNQPIEVKPRQGEVVTEAVKTFLASGENPYKGDEVALSAGKKLYLQWCQGCHLPDGTGRIGPSLIDDTYNYPRTNTDVGMFEVIYAGAGGAMQPFGKRMSQDDILKIMAYVRTLKK